MHQTTVCIQQLLLKAHPISDTSSTFTGLGTSQFQTMTGEYVGLTMKTVHTNKAIELTI